MRINVQDILAEEVGFNRSYTITGETPDFELVKLTVPINGDIRIVKLDDSVKASGDIDTVIELECHRCLRDYEHNVGVRFNQKFSENPQDDDMPIDQNGDIDLDDVLQQEILVSLPIKLLCREDCPGILVSSNDI